MLHVVAATVQFSFLVGYDEHILYYYEHIKKVFERALLRKCCDLASLLVLIEMYEITP